MCTEGQSHRSKKVLIHHKRLVSENLEPEAIFFDEIMFAQMRQLGLMCYWTVTSGKRSAQARRWKPEGAREPLKIAGLIHESWPEGRAKCRCAGISRLTEFCMQSELLKHLAPVPFIQLARGIWCSTEYTSRYLRHGGLSRVLNWSPILANQHPLGTTQQRMTSHDIMSADRVKRDTANTVSCSNFGESAYNGWHRVKLCRRA